MEGWAVTGWDTVGGLRPYMDLLIAIQGDRSTTFTLGIFGEHLCQLRDRLAQSLRVLLCHDDGDLKHLRGTDL